MKARAWSTTSAWPPWRRSRGRARLPICWGQRSRCAPAREPVDPRIRRFSRSPVVREMIENADVHGDRGPRRQAAQASCCLTDAYRALRQIVPDELMTDELRSIIAWLSRSRAVDSAAGRWGGHVRRPGLLPASDGDGTEVRNWRWRAGGRNSSLQREPSRTFRTVKWCPVRARGGGMSRDNVGQQLRDRGPRAQWSRRGARRSGARWLERYWAEHGWIIDQRARACRYARTRRRPADVLELAPHCVDRDRALEWCASKAIADAVDRAAAGTFWLATRAHVRLGGRTWTPSRRPRGRCAGLGRGRSWVALATVTVRAR